jgi:hypothetical protein
MGPTPEKLAQRRIASAAVLLHRDDVTECIAARSGPNPVLVGVACMTVALTVVAAIWSVNTNAAVYAFPMFLFALVATRIINPGMCLIICADHSTALATFSQQSGKAQRLLADIGTVEPRVGESKLRLTVVQVGTARLWFSRPQLARLRIALPAGSPHDQQHGSLDQQASR